jgi:tetratricopeptide (TPR) repeat protein
MNIADYYYRVINWPDRTAFIALFSVAVGLLVVAAVILGIGKMRRFARGLGIFAVVLITALLWAVREQTVTARKSAHITVTTQRYSERTRTALLAAVVALPVLSSLVMLSVLFSTRRRLRAMVPSRLKAGRKHHAQKKYEAALREYNEAIQTSPQLAEAYFRRGSLYKTMGENSLALADFERAIERDPEHASAYLQRGKMCLESGDFESALADFGKLMSIRANDPESHLNRGICLVKKGRFAEAAADFQRVLKLTNHSDFAEPAKKYLTECQSNAPRSLPAAGTNGQAATPTAS